MKVSRLNHCPCIVVDVKHLAHCMPNPVIGLKSPVMESHAKANDESGKLS